MWTPISQAAWIAHFRAHLPMAVEGVDPEGVHQVRVAAQRLRVWLQLAELRSGTSELRSFRRSLSRIRDLEVLLAEDPAAAFEAWLREAWRAERPHAVEVLGDPGIPALLDRLDALPPASPLGARRVRARMARQALERGDELELDPDSGETFHALRRAVRRLRYALELSGEASRKVKALQAALGHLNDQEVRLAWLAEYPHPEQLQSWRAALEVRRDGARVQGLDTWRRVAPVLLRLSRHPDL